MSSPTTSTSENRIRSRRNFVFDNSISCLKTERTTNIDIDNKNKNNYYYYDNNRIKMMMNFNQNPNSSFLILAYILLIITAITITIVNGNNICGATVNFLYCNCDNHDNALEADCFTIGENISSNDPKWQWFSKYKSLKRLKLSGYNNVTLQKFPKILFQSQTLRNSLHDVVLSDLQFKTLPTGSFQNMSQLLLVDISLCSLMEIQTNAFDNLIRLEKIAMTKNNISTLPRMFRNVPSLRELFLEDNNITKFERGVFESLENLNYLTLDNNKIQTLSSYYFDGLVELNSLDLRYNQIEHLPSRVFEKLSKLEILDLSHNKIVDIDEEAFVGLKQLKELQIKNNKLKQIGTQLRVMENLIEIDLDDNEIQALSKYSFYRPDQKRFVSMKLRDNQLYCNCQLFWLKEAFEMNPENRNYNNKQRCYLGQGQYSNDLTIVQFLMDNLTIEQCTLPLPPTIATIDDDIETEPIETIDSIEENFNEKIDDLPDIPTDGDKNTEPEIIDKIDENIDDHENSADNNNNNHEPPQLNVAGFDRTNSNDNDNKDNGVCTLHSWSSALALSFLLIIIYHCP
ncbi:hypothetical protein DERF_002175 [Dermatophagoides farinae]|uniref:Uncharacterized protein n=2 Tax=Dermatophagoides farinae TaxID=6954 RepID=A0A922IB25_DERFA|nr:hypothetical protein DERF_002175 [Dermatophagoides farinae]